MFAVKIGKKNWLDINTKDNNAVHTQIGTWNQKSRRPVTQRLASIFHLEHFCDFIILMIIIIQFF